jgi:hypothetical protein
MFGEGGGGVQKKCRHFKIASAYVIGSVNVHESLQ